MKPNSFLVLLFNCFPFVREYRIRRMRMQRKKIYRKLYKERNEPLKHSLIFSKSIRRF